jgi:hypothetical protein
MHVDRIEIILLSDRDSPSWAKIDPNLFAVHKSDDCFLIGVISEQSQHRCDIHGGSLEIQQGTHSAPCSFNDVIELFGCYLSKLRFIDASVATFRDESQFAIPRFGETGFVVDVTIHRHSKRSNRNNKLTNDKRPEGWGFARLESLSFGWPPSNRETFPTTMVGILGQNGKLSDILRNLIAQEALTGMTPLKKIN